MAVQLRRFVERLHLRVSPTLQSYTTGMVLAWKPNVNGAGGATTLNVDTLGAVPVKQADGVTDPTSADIVAGRLYNVWHDGAVFRLIAPPVNAASAATQPACSAAQRGPSLANAGWDGRERHRHGVRQGR